MVRLWCLGWRNSLGILKKFIAFALPSMFVTTATLSVYGVMTWVANMSGVLVAAAGKVTVSIFQFFAFCGEPMFQTMTVGDGLFPLGALSILGHNTKTH